MLVSGEYRPPPAEYSPSIGTGEGMNMSPLSAPASDGPVVEHREVLWEHRVQALHLEPRKLLLHMLLLRLLLLVRIRGPK